MLNNTKLRDLRLFHGKTQKQIADFCGTSIRYIKMIEHNERTPAQEMHDAWLNCCYGIGKPLKRTKGDDE